MGFWVFTATEEEFHGWTCLKEDLKGIIVRERLRILGFLYWGFDYLVIRIIATGHWFLCLESGMGKARFWGWAFCFRVETKASFFFFFFF